MTIFGRDFWPRAAAALAAARQKPELAALVNAEADAFFAAHPQIVRDQFSEAYLAVIILERLEALQTPADSQSAPTQKIA